MNRIEKSIALIVGIAFLGLPFGSFAQTIQDAIRFSTLNLSGSARSMGAGNTFGAIGADFSNLSTNPAGLGLFRKSEFYISPQLQFVNAESRLVGEQNIPFTEERTRFNFTGVGYIGATETMGNWRTVNFGIGYNRLADFHRNSFYDGTGEGSIGEFFTEQADGFLIDELDGFVAGPAYDAGIIFEDPTAPGTGTYLNDIGQEREMSRTQSIRNTGQFGELAFSMAGNYDEKLMLGITLGVPIIRFNSVDRYEEQEVMDVNPIYESLTFEQRLQTSGEGVNVKLGGIYRVNQTLRFSLAYHSPSLLRLEEDFSNSATYVADFTGAGNETFQGESPEGFFEYRLRTPGRLSGGLGVILGEHGLFTAEAEMINYAGANFNFIDESAADALYERELNNQIDRDLRRAFNFKAGGEASIDIFRLRAGIGFNGTPNKVNPDFNMVYSFGAGIRERVFYFDVAYQRAVENDLLTPYLLSDESRRPQVNEQFVTTRMVATVGLRF